MILDFKATMEASNAWCSACDCKTTITASQPYRDDTWRIEFHCKNYDCDECGITFLMEVKA